MYYSMIIKSYW